MASRREKGAAVAARVQGFLERDVAPEHPNVAPLNAGFRQLERMRHTGQRKAGTPAKKVTSK